jgi:hypothetical protein
MKQATEYICGLRYKLRMMGITVDEPAYVFGDNQSVLANMTAAPQIQRYCVPFHSRGLCLRQMEDNLH